MDKPLIVLISGCQGSGKSSLSRGLSTKMPIYELKFAEVIYKMHDAALAVAKEYGIPVLAKEGGMLQYFGTEFGRNTKGEDVWVNALKHKAKGLIRLNEGQSINITIDDCRFINEFHAFDDMDVNVLKVRLNADQRDRMIRTNSWRENSMHPSETALDGYDADGMFDLYVNTSKSGFSQQETLNLVYNKVKEIRCLNKL